MLVTKPQAKTDQHVQIVNQYFACDCILCNNPIRKNSLHVKNPHANSCPQRSWAFYTSIVCYMLLSCLKFTHKFAALIKVFLSSSFSIWRNACVVCSEVKLVQTMLFVRTNVIPAPLCRVDMGTFISCVVLCLFKCIVR